MTELREFRLFVDDEREAPEGWTPAMTVSNALTMLELLRVNRNAEFTAVSLDYDLGFGNEFDYETGFEALTTIPILQWMAEKNFWPTEIYVHSANQDGEEILLDALEQYGKTTHLRGYGCNFWGTGSDSVLQTWIPE